MAAKIEQVKTAPREVRGAAKTYTVQLVPAGLLIREKGRKTGFGPISYDALYALGARIEAGVGQLTTGGKRRRG